VSEIIENEKRASRRLSDGSLELLSKCDQQWLLRPEKITAL